MDTSLLYVYDAMVKMKDFFPHSIYFLSLISYSPVACGLAYLLETSDCIIFQILLFFDMGYSHPYYSLLPVQYTLEDIGQ